MVWNVISPPNCSYASALPFQYLLALPNIGKIGIVIAAYDITITHQCIVLLHRLGKTPNWNSRLWAQESIGRDLLHEPAKAIFALWALALFGSAMGL